MAIKKKNKDGTISVVASVEEINKTIYPGYEKDLAAVLDKLGYDPAIEIVNTIKRIDTIVELKGDKLTAKEVLEYTKMRLDADKNLLPFVYGKVSTKHDTKRLNVTADYGSVIDKLSEKRLGTLVDEDVIDGQWDET